MTHNVWHIWVLPVLNSPNSSVIELLSNPPPSNVSNSFEPDVIRVNFFLSWRAIVLGCIFSFVLVWIGIICEIVILLFQIVTLPVEFDASRRALKKIKEYEILDNKELSGGQTMLTAAALTYVASVASTIIEIFRLILIYGRRDDRN